MLTSSRRTRTPLKGISSKPPSGSFTRKMSKLPNSNFIYLIPEMNTVDSVTDFRPIACYSLFYKIISKILVIILPHFLSLNQGAFTKVIVGQDCTLLPNRPMVNFKVKRSTPKVYVKLDLTKAYDNIYGSCSSPF